MTIDYQPEDIDLERRERERLLRYRNVFGSAEGLMVLGDILVRNHFGVPLNSEIERVEYNVAIEIARMSGIMSAIDKQLGIGED